MRLRRVGLLSLLLSTFSGNAQELQRFTFSEPAMGTRLNLIFYASDSVKAKSISEAVFAKVRILNAVFSDYDQQSELMQLCYTYKVNKPMRVSDALFDILDQAQKVSQLTTGAFDVTVGACTKLWRKAMKDNMLPSEAYLLEAIKTVGYQNMILNAKDKTVKFTVAGTQLDLGGIAKGYTADELMKILRKHTIEHALIDFGGDILVSNPPPDKNGWNVEVNYQNQFGKPVAEVITISNAAIATSGDYYQKLLIDGKTYSHIIDPSTGLGLTKSVQVTVIASSGSQADSFASAFSVMSEKETQEFLKKDSRLQVLILSKDKNSIKIWSTELFDELRSNGTKAKEQP